MDKPEYVLGKECPECGEKDTVGLELEGLIVRWGACGHLIIQDGPVYKVVHNFCSGSKK